MSGYLSKMFLKKSAIQEIADKIRGIADPHSVTLRAVETECQVLALLSANYAQLTKNVNHLLLSNFLKGGVLVTLLIELCLFGLSKVVKWFLAEFPHLDPNIKDSKSRLTAFAHMFTQKNEEMII